MAIALPVAITSQMFSFTRLLTKDRGAEWIYDNSLAGITQIKINWDELDLNSKNPSPKCWSSDRLIPRPPQKPK
jgi:hypothetical protein